MHDLCGMILYALQYTSISSCIVYMRRDVVLENVRKREDK